MQGVTDGLLCYLMKLTDLIKMTTILQKSYPIKINPKKSQNWSKYNSLNHLKYKSQINKVDASVTKALKKVNLRFTYI